MKQNKTINLIIKKRFILVGIIVIITLITTLIYVASKYIVKGVENSDIKLTFDDRFEELKKFEETEYNSVGWLQVQGTNIDFPVVSYSDVSLGKNAKYAWRSPYYVTGENREVIFGHNIINVSSEPLVNMDSLTAFEGLLAFVYEDFASENLYIRYTKDDQVELYKIYAIRFTDYSEEEGDSFSSKKATKEYIEKVLKDSIYDYDIDVTEDDELLTLKTCTRYFGLNEKQEFSIDARKVRNDEMINKYGVKRNKNYDILNKDSNA